MTANSLRGEGVETIWEAPAPVGDTPALNAEQSQGELFPHLMGGIPPSAVSEEMDIVRSESGEFLSIVLVST